MKKNKSRIRVSVIIPVYNRENFIGKCIESVLSQTEKNIEAICVNDGSTDDSLQILQRYAENDSRIVIINQKNQGLGAARNNALKKAQGEYILYLDSDDWILLDSIKELYAQAKKYDLDLIHFNASLFNDQNNKIIKNQRQVLSYLNNIKIKKFYISDEIDNFMLNIPVSSCYFFYRRDLIFKYKIFWPEKVLYEDNYYLRSVLIKIKNFGVNKKPFYCRRMHENQMTNHFDKGKLYLSYLNINYKTYFLLKNFRRKKDLKQIFLNQLICDNIKPRFWKLNFKQRLQCFKELKSFLTTMIKVENNNLDDPDLFIYIMLKSNNYNDFIKNYIVVNLIINNPLIKYIKKIIFFPWKTYKKYEMLYFSNNIIND